MAQLSLVCHYAVCNTHCVSVPLFVFAFVSVFVFVFAFAFVFTFVFVFVFAWQDSLWYVPRVPLRLT